MSKDFNYQQVADTVADNNADRQNAAAMGQFASQALQVYQQHLIQQKLDTLANMTMAAQNQQNDQSYAVANAQKATPVTSDGKPLAADGSNAVFGDGTSASNPPTLNQEKATNVSLSESDPSILNNEWITRPNVPAAPGDLPATGGYAALQMRQTAQKLQAQSALINSRLQNYGTRQQDWQANQDRMNNQFNTRTQNSQNNFNTNQTRLNNTYGPGAAAKAVTDTPAKFNSDLQMRYGHDFGEFQNVGQEDTVPQNGGVLYRFGGGKVNGVTQPKSQVFLSQPEVDEMNQRYQGLVSGKPVTLNQPSSSAAMYQSQIGAPAPSGATPTASPAAADPLSQARTAIAAGADPDLVKARLQASGVDTTGL